MSAELATNTPEENHRRSVLLEYIFHDLDAKFEKVEGYYKGIKEVSYMVFLNIPQGITTEVFALIAFNKFNQESILHRGTDNVATLIYHDHSEIIGKCVEINAKLANELENFTRFPKTNRYMGVI